MAHHSLAGPKIDQRPTDKTATDLVGQLRRFKADGSSAPATTPVEPSTVVLAQAAQLAKPGFRADATHLELAYRVHRILVTANKGPAAWFAGIHGTAEPRECLRENERTK